jgi:hypothetical protein
VRLSDFGFNLFSVLDVVSKELCVIDIAPACKQNRAATAIANTTYNVLFFLLFCASSNFSP